jgi:TatD DNase family protein
MGEPAEAERACRVAALWPDVRFAIGVHPHEAGQFGASAAEVPAQVRRAVETVNGARAIGEIGLDYHYDLSPHDVQRTIFDSQVALAGEMQLPVVVHTREAEADTVAVLDRGAACGVVGVLHCFTGTLELASWALAAGFYISFAGIVTFANADALRAVAREVPLDRLLVETDCPYLAPVPFRGRRNEPAHVVEVAATIARLKGISLEQLDDAVTANFQSLFRV